LWSRFVVVGQCASCCSSVGDVSLLCCVLNRTDGRLLSPGQTNVVYLTTLVYCANGGTITEWVVKDGVKSGLACLRYYPGIHLEEVTQPMNNPVHRTGARDLIPVFGIRKGLQITYYWHHQMQIWNKKCSLILHLDVSALFALSSESLTPKFGTY